MNLSGERAFLLSLRVGVAAFLVLILSRTWADPDLWGHVLFGRDILQAGNLPSSDPYSFTADKAWVNHEWLAEVLMYLAYASAGSLGLIVLKTALMLGAAACVLAALRSAALSPPMHDLLVFLFVAGTFGRAHAFRPQVFSIALFGLLLLILRTAERGHLSRLWLVPLIFAFWVNLHGGWLVGLGVFGLWTGLKLFFGKDENARPGVLLGVGATTITATLVNPYGWRLWGFLSETVGLGRDAIADWQPLWTLSPLPLLPWIMCAGLGLFAIFKRRSEINWRFAAIVCVCGVGSILVSRLDAFFVVATLMLLGPAMAPRTAPAGKADWRPIALIGAVAVCTMAFVATSPRFSCVQVDSKGQPEPEVVRFVKDRGLHGRMLTFFDWGEYAIWHMAPGVSVSMDGRRETIYSERVIADHLKVYRDDPTADNIVEDLNPDYVWLPAKSGVLGRLEASGWTRVFSGPVSTILARLTMAREPVVIANQPGPRCFPGP